MKRFYPLISLVTFVIILISMVYLWHPKYQEYSLNKEHFEKTKEIIEESDIILAEMRETKNKLKNYEEFLSKIGIAVSDESFLELDLSLFMLENMDEFNLIEFLTEVEVDQEGEEIIINIQVAGTYDDVLNFLGFLHQNYKIFKIDSMAFVSSGAENQLWLFDVTLITYRSLEKEEVIVEREDEIIIDEIY